MATGSTPRVPRDVALCTQCPARYLPGPGEAAVLIRIGPLDTWARTIIHYAIEAGWQRQADKGLVCPAHELSTTRTP